MSNLETQLELLSRQLISLSDKIDEAAKKRQSSDDRLFHIEQRLTEVEDSINNDLWEWVKENWKLVVTLSVPIMGLVSIIFTAVATGVWQTRGPQIISFLSEELQTARIESKILFQPEGLSFIKSPVEEGGVTTYVLVAKRTEFGSNCVYDSMTPIYTDELGRSLLGEFESKGRQYGTQLTRTELELKIPDGLIPGRVVVVLQIKYQCDGEFINYSTHPVAFELLPKGID